MTETTYFELRRCIIKVLYEKFKVVPYATVDFKDIENHCGTDPQILNWNMVYLEKCGFVELGKSFEAPPYIACSAAISAKGIDLIENQEAFDNRFPPDP